ncbi:unnamed protein product, partial [Staurois parvus]
MSVPKAVTPSYTRAYHAALHRESLQSLPCPSLRDVSSAVSLAISSGTCRHLASVFRSLGCTGAAGGGKFEKLSFFFKTSFTYALSCALPAFCLFFL